MFIKTESVELIRQKINSYATDRVPFFFSVDYELSQGVITDNPLNQTDIYFMFNGTGNKPSETATSEHRSSLKVYETGIEEYRQKFTIAHQALVGGVAKVVNLTARTHIDPGMTLNDIFLRSTSPYQVYMPDHFVCFSPERFIKISGEGIISSNPMKGTIDAALPDAERQILENPKEIAEHTATAKLIADELSAVAAEVHISKFRYIDRIVSRDRELLQVSSEVVGTLPDDYHSRMGDIIFDLLPAGSIAGSPRIAALDLIQRAEGQPRGYYCGIAGYYDGSTLDTAVLIRFIEKEGGKYYFRSGGGVTADSLCQAEYQEVLNKIYLPF